MAAPGRTVGRILAIAVEVLEPVVDAAPRDGRITRAPVTHWELTTVADDYAVAFRGAEFKRYDGLSPDTEYAYDGLEFRTLVRPGGDRLSTIATVNDVHFGETECGVVGGNPNVGPILRVEPGEDPYPDTMNRAAVAEIKALAPDAVIAKGDLTTNGSRAEYQQFLDCYGAAFGDVLHTVWGNHDGYHGERFADDAPFSIDVDGATCAVLDTVIPRSATGHVGDEQLAWLDDLAATADRPILAFGHHHPWAPGSRSREPGYFGIHPDDSERLVDVVASRPSVIGYFAGHTHRNRVRRFAATGDVPWVEVACVKDFPGAWAEYRVFEGGVIQVFHRITDPVALSWTERTRAMFGGLYADYAFGTLNDRCFAISLRGPA